MLGKGRHYIKDRYISFSCCHLLVLYELTEILIVFAFRRHDTPTNIALIRFIICRQILLSTEPVQTTERANAEGNFRVIPPSVFQPDK
jgi:hypothetical protein